MSAAAAVSQAQLRFDGERDAELTQYAVTASVGQLRPSGWSLRASVGAIVDGELVADGRHHDLGPGVVGAFSVARPWTRGPWFVIGSATLGASRVTTREDSPGASRVGLVAADARVGASLGRRLGPVSPYLLARAFGGPVLWTLDGDDQSGTDRYHVQLGAGATVALGDAWTLVVDVSALGERAASLGVGWRR